MIYLLSVSISNHNHQLYLVVVVGHDIVVIITLMHVICFSFFHFYDDDVDIFFRPSNRKNPSFIFRQQKKKKERTNLSSSLSVLYCCRCGLPSQTFESLKVFEWVTVHGSFLSIHTQEIPILCYARVGGGDWWNVQSVFVILVGSTGWSVFSPPPPLCSSDGPRVLPQGVEHLVSIYTFFGLLIQCFSHSITILFSFLLTCWFSLSEGGG